MNTYQNILLIKKYRIFKVKNKIFLFLKKIMNKYGWIFKKNFILIFLYIYFNFKFFIFL